MDQAQKILDNKRISLRDQKLQKLREYSNPSYEYRKKVDFIDGNIEDYFRYYDKSENKDIFQQIYDIKKQVSKKIRTSSIKKENT